MEKGVIYYQKYYRFDDQFSALYDKEKLLKQDSKDPLVRESYFSLLKIYKKTRKKKLKDFRKNIIDELDNLKENNYYYC
jgi:hypothetical protein